MLMGTMNVMMRGTAMRVVLGATYSGTTGVAATTSSALALALPPSPTRRIFVAVGFTGISAAARTIASATIGGVAATIICQPAAIGVSAGWITAVVPTGTTAVVVVTLNGTGYCQFILFEMDGSAATSAADTDAVGSVSSTGETANVDEYADGVTLYASNNNLSATSATWTSAIQQASVISAFNANVVLLAAIVRNVQAIAHNEKALYAGATRNAIAGLCWRPS